MIEVIIPEQHYELFDEEKEEFLPPVNIKETKIQLEHSLIALRKWEQKWKRPFLGNGDDDEKTREEIVDYVRCMTLNHSVDPEVYNWIPEDVMKKIIEYIRDPMTATWFKKNNLIGAQKNSREAVTAELIYYWMIALSIPVEFEKWHLNQLLTLIKVVSIKNGKQEKVDPKEAARERAELNRLRRAKYKSKG